jgi:alkylation response protein AidB-like acyl-CoA dehydrogenase
MLRMAIAPERELVLQAVRELARERIAPRAREIDETAEFPWDMVELFRENDLFGLPFDEELGGTGTGALVLLRAVEEVAKFDATVSLLLAVQELGSLAVKLFGTDEHKRFYVPRWASGEWLAAYALTEPESGSDSAAMRTSARRDGDEYVLDGQKRFITNAGVAHTYCVFAKTDTSKGHAGISAFMVHADDPGFSVGRMEHKMGIRGSTTGDLLFEGCRIPADRLIGGEGDGFRIAMEVLDRSRPGVAAQALGLAQGSIDYAVAYAKQRVAFGKPIAAQQGIQFMLADMQAKTEGARQVLYKVGELIDSGADGPELTRMSAISKLLCSDVAMEVTTDAVQILGGYGYIGEYPVERMMRDAKITQIYEGTNQIQRLVIARHMLADQ